MIGILSILSFAFIFSLASPLFLQVVFAPLWHIAVVAHVISKMEQKNEIKERENSGV